MFHEALTHRVFIQPKGAKGQAVCSAPGTEVGDIDAFQKSGVEERNKT